LEKLDDQGLFICRKILFERNMMPRISWCEGREQLGSWAILHEHEEKKASQDRILVCTNVKKKAARRTCKEGNRNEILFWEEPDVQDFFTW
jgi:hypothetical protein